MVFKMKRRTYNRIVFSLFICVIISAVGMALTGCIPKSTRMKTLKYGDELTVRSGFFAGCKYKLTGAGDFLAIGKLTCNGELVSDEKILDAHELFGE